MRKLAIVGSGPAGIYTAEAALMQFGDFVSITLIDGSRSPFGLVRSGVAPDHQPVKQVVDRYAAILSDPRVHFLGGVQAGTDVSIDALRDLFDDVILATGAPGDRPLDIPGADLRGVIGATAFVGWYNGHSRWRDLKPPLAGRRAIVVGNGNVALDCARILARTPERLRGSDITAHALSALEASSITDIHIIGRRGPHQARFSLRELEEIGALRRTTPIVDPLALPPPETDAALAEGPRRMVSLLRRFAAHGADLIRPVRLHFDFFRRPYAIEGDAMVEAVRLQETRLDPHGNLIDGERQFRMPCDLVVTAIGYRSEPVAGVPYDDDAGRFANTDGAILPGLWCVGWARRGPVGTIGSTRPDGFHIVERITATPPSEGKAGYDGLVRLLADTGVRATALTDWAAIDAAEIAGARAGAPREKIVDPAHMEAVVASRPQAM